MKEWGFVHTTMAVFGALMILGTVSAYLRSELQEKCAATCAPYGVFSCDFTEAGCMTDQRHIIQTKQVFP